MLFLQVGIIIIWCRKVIEKGAFVNALTHQAHRKHLKTGRPGVGVVNVTRASTCCATTATSEPLHLKQNFKSIGWLSLPILDSTDRPFLVAYPEKAAPPNQTFLMHHAFKLRA